MEEGPYKSEQHPVSRRLAIFEDDGTCCYLYLTVPGNDAVVADAFVYNRIDAPSRVEVHESEGQAPPLPREYANAHTRCLDPASHRWSFQ